MEGIVAVLIIMVITTLTLGLSWGATCLVVKGITMCFGWVFTWKLATGIWLVMMLLKSIFNVTVNARE